MENEFRVTIYKYAPAGNLSVNVSVPAGRDGSAITIAYSVMELIREMGGSVDAEISELSVPHQPRTGDQK